MRQLVRIRPDYTRPQRGVAYTTGPSHRPTPPHPEPLGSLKGGASGNTWESFELIYISAFWVSAFQIWGLGES